MKYLVQYKESYLLVQQKFWQDLKMERSNIYYSKIVELGLNKTQLCFIMSFFKTVQHPNIMDIALQ